MRSAILTAPVKRSKSSGNPHSRVCDIESFLHLGESLDLYIQMPGLMPCLQLRKHFIKNRGNSSLKNKLIAEISLYKK